MSNLVQVEHVPQFLKIEDIHPNKSPAFSPNLYRWMKRNAHFFQNGGSIEKLYLVREGTPSAKYFGAGTYFIGSPYNQYPGDCDFSGSRLIAVLCNGAKEQSFCYPNMSKDLDEVPDFWSKYLKIGRCAIDPGHHELFRDKERYKVDGGIRECLWCGAKHRIEARYKQVEVSEYVPL